MNDVDGAMAIPRRHFLKLSGGLAVMGLAASLSPVSKAVASMISQDDFNDFNQLSHLLCGRQELDPELSRIFFDALSQSFPDFIQRQKEFKQWVDKRPEPLRNMQQTIDAENKTLGNIPRLIAAAWYLGVVGNRAYSYEQSLMYQPIKDMVVLPTYARGEPGYWQKKPYPLPFN